MDKQVILNHANNGSVIHKMSKIIQMVTGNNWPPIVLVDVMEGKTEELIQAMSSVYTHEECPGWIFTKYGTSSDCEAFISNEEYTCKIRVSDVKGKYTFGYSIEGAMGVTGE